MRTPLLLAGSLTAALCACDGGRSAFRLDTGNPLQPVVEFGAAEVRVTEGETVIGVPVTLTSEPAQSLQVPYEHLGSATEGVDFVVLTPSPLVVAKGQVQAEILFQVFEDSIGEVDESIRLELGEVEHAELGEQVRSVLRIEDDDSKEVEESEPNDDLPGAQELGYLRLNAGCHAHGLVVPAGSSGDVFDVYRMTAWTDLRMRLALDAWSAGVDVALRVLDEGGGTLYVLDQVGVDDFEEGELLVGAGQVFFLEVTTQVAGTDYLLQIAGEPPPP